MPCASTRPDARARARLEAAAILRETGLVRPVFTYRLWPVAQLEGSGMVPGAVGREALALAAAACTLGSALEERVRALFRGGRRLLALELDAAANGLLFCLSRTAYAAIGRAAARRGMRTGDELNPGDPGLALGEQANVLRLAGAGKHGIVANGHAMLCPVKSLSFVVPLGPGLAPRAGGRCSRCPARERCRVRAN